MRKEVLIARTDPDSIGQYEELYMTGYLNGPAVGFIYHYDPSPGAKKNRVKKRLSLPLYIAIAQNPYWKPAINQNLAPSLWDPNSADPKAEDVERMTQRWLRNV